MSKNIPHEQKQTLNQELRILNTIIRNKKKRQKIIGREEMHTRLKPLTHKLGPTKSLLLFASYFTNLKTTEYRSLYSFKDLLKGSC